MFGGPGKDWLFDPSGRSRLFGGGGRDHATAFGGPAVVRGGKGSDGCLMTRDAAPDDVVVGGRGRDGYRVDLNDVVRSAEVPRFCEAG